MTPKQREDTITGLRELAIQGGAHGELARGALDLMGISPVPEKRTLGDYPDRYPPGTDPDLDEAWRCLDHLKKGLLAPDVRAFIAGFMVSLIKKARGGG